MQIGQTVRFAQVPPGAFFRCGSCLCFKFAHFFWKDVGVPHNIMNFDLGRTDFLSVDQPVEFAGYIEDVRGY
jgi:hypothetical protein